MMTQDVWERMTPSEQGNFWWAELDGMLTEALADVNYQEGNQETSVINGMTTIVGKKQS